jgi:plasmid stability protein
MNTLHVRSVPEDLYRKLLLLAKQGDRSLSAEVVDLLARAVEDEEIRLKQGSTLKSIRRRRFTLPEQSPTSLDLLREDRKR